MSASSCKGQRESSHLVKALRMIRPNFDSSLWPDAVPRCTPIPAKDLGSYVQSQPNGHQDRSASNQSSVSSSSSAAAVADVVADAAADEDHFAPMLSTLNMNPKIVLTRTPVNSPASSPLKSVVAKSPAGKLYTRRADGGDLLRPYVLLDKLEKLHHGRLERTMANLKGLDMIQVVSAV